MQKPIFTENVTHIPAEWANLLSTLAFDVLKQAVSSSDVLDALGLKSMATQSSSEVVITGGHINSTGIGTDEGECYGVFSDMRVKNPPSSPTSVVNEKYLRDTLSNTLATMLNLHLGGTVEGKLYYNGLASEPSEVVSLSALAQYINNNLKQAPIQRVSIGGKGANTVVWDSFSRVRGAPIAENFFCYIDGSLTLPKSILLTSSPTFVFNNPIAITSTLHIAYFENYCLPLPPAVPLLGASLGWSNPINKPVNFDKSNSGINRISESHTVLRELFFSVMPTTAILPDIVAFDTNWDSNPTGKLNPPTIVHVQDLVYKVVLPDNTDDLYFAGRYLIGAIINGIPQGNNLWVDTDNQAYGDFRDGSVAWNTGKPLNTSISIIGCYVNNVRIPNGGTFSGNLIRVDVAAIDVPSNASIEVLVGTDVYTVLNSTVQVSVPVGISNITARIVGANGEIIAFTPVYVVCRLPELKISARVS